MQQFVAVRCRQDFVQGVALVCTAIAFGECQQMQVMVAEHADRGIAEVPDEAQHAERIRPAVDQVADEPQAVGGRIEADGIEQAQKGIVATLKIANGIGRHIK